MSNVIFNYIDCAFCCICGTFKYSTLMGYDDIISVKSR